MSTSGSSLSSSALALAPLSPPPPCARRSARVRIASISSRPACRRRACVIEKRRLLCWRGSLRGRPVGGDARASSGLSGGADPKRFDNRVARRAVMMTVGFASSRRVTCTSAPHAALARFIPSRHDTRHNDMAMHHHLRVVDAREPRVALARFKCTASCCDTLRCTLLRCIITRRSLTRASRASRSHTPVHHVMLHCVALHYNITLHHHLQVADERAARRARVARLDAVPPLLSADAHLRNVM